MLVPSELGLHKAGSAVYMHEAMVPLQTSGLYFDFESGLSDKSQAGLGGMQGMAIDMDAYRGHSVGTSALP